MEILNYTGRALVVGGVPYPSIGEALIQEASSLERERHPFDLYTLRFRPVDGTYPIWVTRAQGGKPRLVVMQLAVALAVYYMEPYRRDIAIPLYCNETPKGSGIWVAAGFARLGRI